MSNATVKAPLTRVTLYKHGIGYFERKAIVNGPGCIELQCGPDEIDDMLKSLVVLKKGGGKVAAVTYESSKPFEERIAEFGFDLRENGGFLHLIAQLKGTPVLVEHGGGSSSGLVVGLDSTSRATGSEVVSEHFLLILSEGTHLERMSVSKISRVEILDEALAGELQQQLELLFLSVKKKDRKLLRIDLKDQEETEIFLAYSIPCPIWKSSYRLIFDRAGKLMLQGVAIVDNIQEEDWDSVAMTLVSAAPVSFIQPLYEPVRPVRKTIGAQGVSSAGPFVAERAQKMKAAPAAPAPAQGMLFGASDAMEPGGWGAAGGALALMSRTAGMVDSLEAMADQDISVAGREHGELFEYRISEPITVPRNNSALIPVVQEYAEGERICLYQEARDQKFPYASVLLKNTTGLTLEAGPVTVMEEDAYAGECLLDVLKPDDRRFLPYALDQSVAVVVRHNHDSTPVCKIKIVNATMLLIHQEKHATSYHLENLSKRDKVVYVEHPYSEGWRLGGIEKPEETTRNFYRFRVELAPGAVHHLAVEEWRDMQTQVHLGGLDPATSNVLWLFEQNFADEKVLAFLKKVADKRREIIAISNEVADLNNKVGEYERRQERARQNVKTLGGEGDRFKKSIAEAEDLIIETQLKVDKLNQKLQEKTAEFNRMLDQELESEITAAVARP